MNEQQKEQVGWFPVPATLPPLPGGMKYLAEFDRSLFRVGHPIEVKYNSGDVGYHRFGLIKKVESDRIVYGYYHEHGDHVVDSLGRDDFEDPFLEVHWILPDRENSMRNRLPKESS